MNDVTTKIKVVLSKLDIAGTMLSEFIAAVNFGATLVSDYQTSSCLMLYARGTKLVQVWSIDEVCALLRDAACSNAPWANLVRTHLTPEQQAQIDWRQIGAYVIDAMAAAVGATASE